MMNHGKGWIVDGNAYKQPSFRGTMREVPPKSNGNFACAHEPKEDERQNVGYSQGAPLGGYFNSSRRKQQARSNRRLRRQIRR